ncbi:MAG TPA: PEP-CTERM sorting domain-containing protein [Planctomycetota bacterium]|nr:PEP-CTERM sorting domain-containing protein [Planctomycetota bacterium]HRR79958.1 PEP-CTERM sorting domain-containing protein [Planctomycetota bacterium]HRT95750.1 PEP-CTERM sorting domain-containing protein [Planctomycetota bacterium]
MKNWSARLALAVALLAACGAPAPALPFNPQEIGMVVENFVIDTDATMIGLLNYAGGNNHPDATFTYRSVWIGPPDSALPGVPLASRTEWQAWRGKAYASLGGDDYIINYSGYMKDTRASALDDPTYTIRWESTWYKNDPSETTSYATGSGGFLFEDPDFNFTIEVDPSNPSNVTIGGSGGATLWGVVNVSISGNKNLGTGVMTASAGVSVDIPLVSDLFGSLASASFELTYNQRTGRYESKIKAQAFFGWWAEEKTVNKGRIVAPAKKVKPPDPEPPRSRPVETGRRNTVESSGGLGSTPTPPSYRVPPWAGPPVTTPNPYDPYGQLAQTMMTSDPNLFNFNTVPITQHSDQYEYLYPHPGFFDPVTFPEDDPSLIPGEGLGFSFMDPTDPFGGGPGPPPGITIGPVNVVPEPGTAVLVGLALLALRRRRRASRESL